LQLTAVCIGVVFVLVASIKLAWLDYKRALSGGVNVPEAATNDAREANMLMWHLLLAGLWVTAAALYVRCSASCADIAGNRAYVPPLRLAMTPQGWAPVPAAPEQRREALFVFPHEDIEG
jgi:hypothetical protein